MFFLPIQQVALVGLLGQKNLLAIEQNRIALEQQRTLEEQNRIAREQQRTLQKIEEQNRATSPYGEHTFTQNGFCEKCGWKRESLVRIQREICPKLALEQKRALNEQNRIAREQQRTLQNIEEQNRQTLKRIEAQNIALKSSMRRMAVREAEKRAKKRMLKLKAKIKRK